ncbi:FAD-dependent monooxygenase [Rhodococcus sp. NPDC060090]|uniref:FAD-dependent monooxygenase n=1 Tax=Rhodococcus sp. NPDC060090 TaxID=3347056 RepID=UPI00365210F8
MNTGIQDAYNLGWKLALAVNGQAVDGRVRRDHAGNTTRTYRFGTDSEIVVVRPDGYIGHRAKDPSMDSVAEYLDHIVLSQPR